MGFPGAHNIRRRPQDLGVARDVSAPRIGDLAHPTEYRTPARTTAVVMTGAAQNGTSGVVACGKRVSRTRGLGHPANRCSWMGAKGDGG